MADVVDLPLFILCIRPWTTRAYWWTEKRRGTTGRNAGLHFIKVQDISCTGRGMYMHVHDFVLGFVRRRYPKSFILGTCNPPGTG